MKTALNSVVRVDVSALTPELFTEKYLGTPVIITGLLEKDCDWNLDYLCDKLGNQEFLFRNYGCQRYQQDKRKWTSIGSGVALQSMPFSKYAELLRNHKAHENDIYLGKSSLQDTILADTYALKTIGKKLGLSKPVTHLNIYMGPGGHSSGLHYDSLDGTLMQMHGEKKVVLFPPSQTYNLYPFPVSIHLLYGLKLRSWFSRVYLEHPDLVLFPKFKVALQAKIEVTLKQGETLYIPMGWWHEVTALGDDMVCSVNRFWRVYPTARAVFSWNRWRAILGNIFALPHMLINLLNVLLSADKNTKEIWHRL